MNRLLTTDTGGFPFNLNDLRFIDDATRLALKDIMNSIVGDQACYMHGCQVTPIEPGDGHHISDGAIFYQGEIWHVYEHTLDYSGIPVWAFYTSNDPDGNKTFKDALQHNTYQIRKAILCPTGSYPPDTLYTLAADQVLELKDVFQGAGLGAPTLLNSTTILPDSNIYVRKSLNMATIHGQINNPYIILQGVTVLNLPAGFRPVFPVSGYCPGNVAGTSTIVMLRYQLGTDGNLKFYSADQGYDVDINVCLTFLTS
jgi:hypothetical protein